MNKKATKVKNEAKYSGIQIIRIQRFPLLEKKNQKTKRDTSKEDPTREDIQMANKSTEKLSTSLEMQISALMTHLCYFHYTL